MSYWNTRIKLNMSFADVAVVMSDGNPGAISAITDIANTAVKVDPENPMQHYAPLFSLDTLNIYGPDIWVLYNDNCRRSAERVIVLHRAYSHGLIKDEEIKSYASDRGPDSAHLTEDRYNEIKAMVAKEVPSMVLS